MFFGSRRFSFHLLQIIEPYISAQDHIQVSIPRVLTVMGTESLSRLQVSMPRARNEGLVFVALVEIIASREESLKDPQRKRERSQRKITQEGVFPKQVDRCEDICCRSLTVGGSIVARESALKSI